MPYPPHRLLAFGGSWNDPAIDQEIWSCSMRFDQFSAGPLGDEIVGNEAAQKVQRFFNTVAFAPKATLEYVKFNPIGPDGKYANETETTEVFFQPPLIRTGTGQLLPLQNTIAVSWTTARSRGIASKGRMFLPGMNADWMTNIGLIGGAHREALVAACKLFIEDCRTWTSEYVGVPAIVSQGAQGGAGPGVAEPIIGVNVGNVVDTQRRRRNALVEARLFADVDQGSTIGGTFGN
jgi:hypothetical protein